FSLAHPGRRSSPSCLLSSLFPRCAFFVFFSWHAAHRDLPSFSTRRSSDLVRLREKQRLREQYNIREKQLRIQFEEARRKDGLTGDRKSTRLNSSHVKISYAVFCLKKKKE